MTTEPNMFLKNLDRTMLTFNMHNVAEVCFNHVFKRKTLQEGGRMEALSGA